jgi:hypothetical protein
MANGYCEALLLHLESIAGQNYPGQKVTMPGFLNMLVTSPDRPSAIQEGYQGGHYRTVNVKYMPRTVSAQVSTSDSCAIDLQPAYKETTVSVNNVAQTGLWISDDTVRQYCEDSSRTVAVGLPPTQLMTEHLRGILHAMNGIYQKMENVLTTSMASTFGNHVATGTATAVAVNIEQDGTLNDLGTGLTKLLTDAASNEFCGTPMFVGALGSLMHAYSIQKNRAALGAASAGVDFGAMTNDFQFFASGQTGSTWGAQHVGMFAPGSVHLVERQDNVGSFAGQRGTSFFTTIVDPRTQCWTPNGLGNIAFDLQVKYIDCPEDLANLAAGYVNPDTFTANRGYALYIKKRYGLFTTPKDAFDGGDRLAGSNGSLRYVVSNT